jgi:hypothetical protein
MLRRLALVVLVVVLAVAWMATAATADQITISGFSPPSAPPGAAVTIAGRGFLNTTAVLFNGTNATFTVTLRERQELEGVRARVVSVIRCAARCPRGGVPRLVPAATR